MKLYLIVVLISLISLSISQNGCVLSTPNASKKNCNSALSDSDKTAGFKYCCYQEYENVKACVPYTQDLYDAIGKAKKSDIKGKIECKSAYLKLGLLGLVIFAL